MQTTWTTQFSLIAGCVSLAAASLVAQVICYAKNHNLGFTIPYSLNGETKL